MASQLQSLKESLARAEARSGAGNPFVQGLKAQIAMYEKPPSENPMQAYSVGTRSEPVATKPPEPSPQKQQEQQSKAEQMAEAYKNHLSKGSTT